MPSITIRIDEDTAAEVDELASALDRTRAWIANTALQRYLREERNWVEDVRAGMAELDRGEGIPHDELMTEIREKIANHQTNGGK